MHSETLWGHPKGLYVLFFTEMWERFSYYGMRALLVLYLVAQTQNGGLGWTNEEALKLYGLYTMLVYLTSIPGGIIADRYLGHNRSVMFGGLLLVAGHSLMAYTALWAFYSAITLIILGCGLLKPNISTLVGGLYQTHDTRRDSAFTIFYMGINLGGFLASLIVGYVGEKIGWHYGFGLAGIGMALGQFVFIWGQKYLKGVGTLVAKTEDPKTHERIPLTRHEKNRIRVLFVAFAIAIIFWCSFEQAGGFLNLYASQYTNRYLFGWEVPASWFQSLNPGFIIVFAGLVAAVWVWLGKRNREPSAIFKMGLGTVIMGMGFVLMVLAALERRENSSGLSSLWWLVGAYWFHTIGELALSPVVLAYITKIAPKRMVASMMGLYFAATGLANKLAAELGAMSEKLGDLAVFAIIAGFSILFGLLLMLVAKKVTSWAHEEELPNNPESESKIA